ncbi:uncharacterized protein LOC128228029 isoform X2 [Mya arenaria]|uniref:uncharacterized protein LOC128228029 isoform X2 n=2 Tax=Mya arenaria TaxID=6604 RepID=UPI0022E13416|nr:uncharacterized protein LOC128228029 isoform X2 [Mya arenaria]
MGYNSILFYMRMKVKVDGMSEKRSSNSSVDHCDPSHNGEDTSDPSPHGDELSDPGCEVHDTCDPCCHGDVSECNLHREETSDPSLNSDGLRDPYHTCDEPSDHCSHGDDYSDLSIHGDDPSDPTLHVDNPCSDDVMDEESAGIHEGSDRDPRNFKCGGEAVGQIGAIKGQYIQEEEGSEETEQDLSDLGTIELPDSASKPDPPPRTDSHGVSGGVAPQGRLMVDSLTQGDGEESFSWDKQRDYLLTCMGFINGLGCLIKAGVYIMKHGGGVFFIAYLLCMLVIGCPLVFLETALGQYVVGGPLNAWKVIPLFSGIGPCMVTLTFLLTCYYAMEVTWAVYYFGIAMATALSGSQLPWQCGNITDVQCYLDSYSALTNSSRDTTLGTFNNTDPHSKIYRGAIQYFYEEVLVAGVDMEELGPPVWYLCLCLLLIWACVYACLMYGPTSIGKVMHVLAPFPYLGLLVLFVMSMLQDGSLTGVRYFLSPDWHKLGAVEIWYDAGKLLFYTLSLGTGCLHTLAGYTHFHSHCYRNFLLICMCNVLAVLFSGLTVCSGLGILANITNTSVENLPHHTEYEVGYAVYPYILTRVSDSTAFLMLYFSVVCVVGVSSLLVLVQTLIEAGLEWRRGQGGTVTRQRRWALQLVLCIFFMAVGILLTTKLGVYIIHYLDGYVTLVMPYIVVLLECCILMYVFGAQKFLHNIEDMTGHKNSLWWMTNWKFVTPCVLMGLITCAGIYGGPSHYGHVQYSGWSEVLGWCLALAPGLWVPALAVWALIWEHGSLVERVKVLLKVPDGWGAGLAFGHEHTPAPDYVICQPDNHRPIHGLAMITASLYIPQMVQLTAEEVPPETGSEMTGGFMSDLMTITSSDSIGSGPENEERGNWRGKLEFILSCLGYVVGLGNIWRFPYLVYRNGGGAFFIPYFVMVTLCGIPLVYMEMAFGQYASLGPVTIWRACPIFKGVGYAMVVTVAIICVYYNIVNAWALHYLFSSFSASLPWASCDNPWNTDACRLNRYEVTNCSLVNATYILSSDTENDNCSQYLLDCMHATNQSAFPKENTTVCIEWLEDQHGEAIYLPERQSLMATLKDPSAEYFYNEVLNISDGLHEMGGVQWQLALYLLLCWVIVFLCLVRGIYSAGKVAYFVVIIPIVILVILLICSMLVDGHLEGIRFYVTPKWDHFLSFRVWSDAASQVFFSLSACSGGLTTLSSYNKFHNNIYRDAIIICVIDTLMSILAGFTVFASLGILAHQLDTSIENVVTSNIGLVFVAFPAAVTNFQPSAMWSAFFFLMIIMMGMSSLLVMTEIIVTVMMDEKVEVFRKSRILVLLVVCSLLYLLGLPLTTRGGQYLLQLLDEFCGGTPSVVVGLFMCLGLAWVYRVRHFCKDIQLMIGHPVSWWWRAMWCIVSPLIMMFILVSTIVSGVDLEDEVYPAWAEGLGIVLVTSTVITIPIYAIKKVSSLEGSIMQRIRESCLSAENWGPALVKHWKHVEYYPAVNTHTLSLDIEHSPVHAITDRVDFSTNDVRAPKLSEASLLSLTRQMSPRKPQQLRQRAILNHAYSNPQCHISNGSLDQVKPHQQEVPLPQTHGYTLIVSPRRSTVVPGVDVATQTDARSFTLALKHGSVRSLKEMKIETGPEVEGRGKHPSSVLHVEVTRF